MNICNIVMPVHLLKFSLPVDNCNGARPKEVPQLTKQLEVKPSRSNHAAELIPIENLRPGSKIAPLEISSETECLPGDDLSSSHTSPSSEDAACRSNGAIGTLHRRDGQGEKRKIKMAVRHRRVTSSAEVSASMKYRGRKDYSSDDSEEENPVLAMKRSLYKMPKMSGNTVSDIFFVFQHYESSIDGP